MLVWKFQEANLLVELDHTHVITDTFPRKAHPLCISCLLIAGKGYQFWRVYDEIT